MTRHETEFSGKDQSHRLSPNMFSEALTHASDIAIVIEADSVVESITVNPDNRGLGRLDHWQGRKITAFMTDESIEKFEARIKDLRSEPTARPRPLEINHFDNAHWEFPVRYTLHAADDAGRVLMIGRDLRPIAEAQQQLVKAQISLEKDYERHRHFETRYRVLMETMRDTMALVDIHSGKIAGLTAGAARLLEGDVDSLTNTAFTQAFDGRQRDEFLGALSEAAASAPHGMVEARTRRSRHRLAMHPTLFRSAGDMMILCRIEPADEVEPVAEDLRDALQALFNQGPDALVFTDAQGVIRHANEGFLTLCDIVQPTDAVGVSFGDFLARGGVDLKVLLDNASRTGRMRMYATKLKSMFGAQVAVEVAVAHLKNRADPYFGFVIRDTSRSEAARPGGVDDDAMRNVMELVGSAPLKELVAATTDVVERMCIETAVELTRNNRVAAAEMLGLSRQSLYVKLRKFGLINKDAEKDGDG